MYENNCAGFIIYFIHQNLCKTQIYKWELITLHHSQGKIKHFQQKVITSSAWNYTKKNRGVGGGKHKNYWITV